MSMNWPIVGPPPRLHLPCERLKPSLGSRLVVTSLLAKGLRLLCCKLTAHPLTLAAWRHQVGASASLPGFLFIIQHDKEPLFLTL